MKRDVNIILDLQYSEAQIDLDELVYHFVNNTLNKEKFLLQYKRLTRLQHLYVQAMMEGWHHWDWQQAENEGWLCTNDYIEYFRQELKNVILSEGWDKYTCYDGRTHKEHILQAQKEENEK